MGRMLAAVVFFFCGTVWAATPQTYTIELAEVSDYRDEGFSVIWRINGVFAGSDATFDTQQYPADPAGLFNGDILTVSVTENGNASYDLYLYDQYSSEVASSIDRSDDYITYKVGSGVGQGYFLQVARLSDMAGDGYTLCTYMNGELSNTPARSFGAGVTTGVVLYPGDVFTAELHSWGEANYDLFLFDSDYHQVASSTSASTFDTITYPSSGGGGGGGECGGGAATLFVVLALLARAARRRRA